MESELVEKPASTKVRRGSSLWPILVLIFFLIAIMMTAVCLWLVLKPVKSRKMGKYCPSRVDINRPCPNHPPLFALSSPLPQRVKKSINAIKKQIIDLVQNPSKGANMTALSIKIIYQNTTLLNGHYGSTLFKGSQPPNDHTIYRIGSVTKILPVLLLFKLYNDRVIASLDDPLVKYAPKFSIKSPFGFNYNITLRQIASQMSGLPREAPCGYRCNNTTTKEQIYKLKKHYLVVKPWTIPSYSNLAYALLGRILTENLLNISFEQWVKIKILDPLGMKDSGMLLNGDVIKRMALPYFSNGNGSVMPFMQLGWAGPAGEMHSTVSDLIKLANIFIYPEKQSIFKPEIIREMLLPEFLTNDGHWLWGSPFEIRFTNHFVAREKAGNVETYNALFSVIPELKFAMAVTVNYSPALKEQGYTAFRVAEDVHDNLLPVLNQTLFEIKSKSSFPGAKAFVGRFQITQISMLTGRSFTFSVTIKESGGTLELVPEKPAFYEFCFSLRYIGDPLRFQGILNAAKNAPCVTSHFGLYGVVKFDTPGADGLSRSFVGISWKIKGFRIKEENSDRATIDTSNADKSRGEESADLDSTYYTLS